MHPKVQTDTDVGTLPLLFFFVLSNDPGGSGQKGGEWD